MTVSPDRPARKPWTRRAARHPLPEAITAIYARVSTDEQAKKGFSLPTQLEACRRKLAPDEPYEEFVDDYTGSTLRRPDMDRLRDRIEARMIKRVVVLCPDRLSREPADLLVLNSDWRGRGIVLDFVQMALDDTPQGEFALGMFALTAKFEKASIIERSTRGRIGKAKADKFPGNPQHVAYGYRREGDKLIIVPERAEVVLRMYRAVDGGRSVLGLMRDLAREGILSPAGTPWTRPGLRKLLRNEIYAGVFYWDRWERRHGQRVERPREQWIPVKVPVIIERALWERVQGRLGENRRLWVGRPNNLPALLRGVAYCVCGQRIYSETKRKHSPIYRCTARQNISRTCKEVHWVLPVVDQAVWTAFTAFATDPDVVLEGLEGRQAQDRSAWTKAVKTWQERLDDLGAQEDRILDLYQRGIVDTANLDARLRKLRETKREGRAEMAVYEGRLAKTDWSGVRAWAKAARPVLGPLKDLGKRAQVFRTVCTRAIMHARQVDVIIRCGGRPKSETHDRERSLFREGSAPDGCLVTLTVPIPEAPNPGRLAGRAKGGAFLRRGQP
jgi:site-specific DNA recombinase